MKDSLQALVQRFLWEPPSFLTDGPGRLLLGPLRAIYALGRDVAAGQLTLRAMSLVYTTILSIVPLIAFSFSVLKGFGFHKELQPLLYTALEPLGTKGVEMTDRIIGFVDNVQGRVLGGIGLALLIYTVITMVQKVENSVNWIWQVKHPRSLARRFSDYLSVLLIGPVLMFAAMGMIASISSHALVQKVTALEPFGTGLLLAGKLLPIVLVSFVFAFIYVFVINTRVKVSAAVVGGTSAGVLWATAGKVFAAFVVGSTKYAAIYSSFAIMIIALIWLYINWLILLLGAQIAFYFQHPQTLRLGRQKIEVRGRRREALALDLMMRVGSQFMQGPPPPTLDALADAMRVPLDSLENITIALNGAGLLDFEESGGLLPGRDLGTIRVSDLLRAVRESSAGTVTLPGAQPAAEKLLDEIEGRTYNHLGDLTLRDLVSEGAYQSDSAERAAVA
ncbi:MAG: YhjD/YihY/BrkB family envelope integrity protein [Gammaproteobacteria bacterium]